MEIVKSVNAVPIRLTPERWLHIVEGHPEIAGHYHDVLGTLAWPEFIVQGEQDEFLAIGLIAPGKYLVVVYKEVNADDGFIITAFFTRRLQQLERRDLVWKRPK